MLCAAVWPALVWQGEPDMVVWSVCFEHQMENGQSSHFFKQHDVIMCGAVTQDTLHVHKYSMYVCSRRVEHSFHGEQNTAGNQAVWTLGQTSHW